ncbi:endothelin-converting enzyme 1-like isoform X2 [Pocillopora verrucosa]|uniref:endothelin-converting enzyme 1-like isoform X2 n=1 Tax=Pocillopora verrucosa TaxID=203993 RepID=UPI003341A230
MGRMGNPVSDDRVELVDDNVGIRYRLRKCGKTRLVIIAVVVAVLVIGGIVAAAYLLTRPLICKTEECYKISKVISNQIDTSKDPCDDFYAYACGGFIKTHQLKGNQSSVGGFTIVNDDNMKVLQQAMVNASTKYNQSSSILKTVKIYDSCLNTSAIESRGNSPLKKMIEDYGGWSVSGNGSNSWLVEEKMGRVLRDLNVQTLLQVTVGTDLEDSSKHILNLNIASLGMSFKYYFDQEDSSVKVRTAYKTYMKTIAKLLGGGPSSDYKMDAIYDFERSIAESVDPDTVSEDIIESLMEHHRSGRSLDELDKTIEDFWFASDFDTMFVTKFLDAAFYKQGKYFSSNDNIYYPQAEVYTKVFKAMAKQYHQTDKQTVKDYIMWRVIDNYVMSMPDKFVQAKLKYVRAVRGLVAYERWSECLETMISPVGFTLGRLYVDANFDESTKTTVKDMTARLRQSFIDNLDDADWMDYSTKQSAKGKAKAIQEDIGYPPFIKDNKKLDEQYSLLNAGDDYFENTVSMKYMVVQKNFDLLGKPVDKDMWMESPAQVNGYYSPQQNRIVFLAGILQSPFYRKNYPKYIDYGSLAMVIGHEITHGFDSQGRLYDKNGNVKNWWSLSSTYSFASKAECLVNQYNNYDVFGTYIDGKQTLNENIADNGGIKLAYDAYESWVKDNKKEGQLPDLGLSVDQLFFIGFATPWCSVYKKEAALFQVESDVHSFPKYRVIGPLSNFKTFADAYSCKKGKEMNPGQKCSVW